MSSGGHCAAPHGVRHADVATLDEFHAHSVLKSKCKPMIHEIIPFDSCHQFLSRMRRSTIPIV